MDKKLITLRNIEDLDYLAEEALHELRFNGFQYDEKGNYLLDLKISKEVFREFQHSALWNILEFRESQIVQRLSLTKLTDLSLGDIKRDYLKDILPKARNIMRVQAPYFICGRLSEKISDEYLEDIFAIHWRWNAMLWVVQRKKNSNETDECRSLHTHCPDCVNDTDVRVGDLSLT